MDDRVILIVDDDESDVLFLRKALLEASPGLTIHAVSDGQEALDYLQGRGSFGDRTRYPLPTHLFLDLKMPRLSGLEVLQWIRQQRELGRLPVTVLSGSQLSGDQKRAAELGAEYIVKPVEYGVLLKIARDFCRKAGLIRK